MLEAKPPEAAPVPESLCSVAAVAEMAEVDRPAVPGSALSGTRGRLVGKHIVPEFGSPIGPGTLAAGPGTAAAGPGTADAGPLAPHVPTSLAQVVPTIFDTNVRMQSSRYAKHNE